MNGRDRRRKAKAHAGRGERPFAPTQNPNPAGMTVLPRVTESAGGKYCPAREARVDASVCTVQSTRQPALCRGCIS